MADETSALGQAYKAYESLEGRLSSALDQLVTTNGFAELLATSAVNVLAVSRVASEAIDQAMRVTRLAVRQDVTNLARQLARTEDKLEKVLQLVEELESRLAAQSGQGQAPATSVEVPSATNTPAEPAASTTAKRTARRRAAKAGTIAAPAAGAPAAGAPARSNGAASRSRIRAAAKSEPAPSGQGTT